MEEQNVQEEAIESEETPNGEEEVDWEAKYKEAIKHSRDWERRSKENKSAAEELERLKAERMTEAERLQARAEKAEAELARLTAEREQNEAAAEVSKKTDVPQELLLFCKDAEAMEAFAEAYKRLAQTATPDAAPKSRKSRIIRDSETPTANRDVFAEMAANLL